MICINNLLSEGLINKQNNYKSYEKRTSGGKSTPELLNELEALEIHGGLGYGTDATNTNCGEGTKCNSCTSTLKGKECQSTKVDKDCDTNTNCAGANCG